MVFRRPPRSSLGPDFRSLLVLLSSTALFGCFDRTPDFTPEELAEATAQVRQAFRIQDNEHGAYLGKKWLALAPDALELKAWTVANLTWCFRRDDEAVELAQEMVATAPDSSWTSFALAAARTWVYPRDFPDEALEASERAVAGLPGITEAILVRGRALSLFVDPDSALAFEEALPAELRRDPAVRAMRADLLRSARSERSDASPEHQLAILEEILEEDPDHLEALMGVAYVHTLDFDDEETALEYFERAAATTPSPMVHETLWSQIERDTTLTWEEKVERISADVRGVMENFEESPARLGQLAENLYYYDMPGPQAVLDNRILAKYPDSRPAEAVLGRRFQELAQEVWREPIMDEQAAVEKPARLRAMLKEHLARPEHHDQGLLFEANWNLYILEKDDPNVDPAYLSKLASGWSASMEAAEPRYAEDHYIYGAIPFAERGEFLEQAKQFLDLGREEVERKEAEAKEEDPEEELDPKFRADRALIHAVKAMVLIQEGNLDDAETALAYARDVDPEDFHSYVVLPLADLFTGRLHEARADQARANGGEADAGEFLRSAEAVYLQGIRADYYPRPNLGISWTNPNEPALEALYVRMHGSTDGFEDYLAAIKKEGWEERKAEVLAQRLDNPKPLVPFALETLDGKVVTSESYLGKVVVINFWGTW
jgi:hypothetical protein